MTFRFAASRTDKPIIIYFDSARWTTSKANQGFQALPAAGFILLTDAVHLS